MIKEEVESLKEEQAIAVEQTPRPPADAAAAAETPADAAPADGPAADAPAAEEGAPPSSPDEPAPTVNVVEPTDEPEERRDSKTHSHDGDLKKSNTSMSSSPKKKGK